jgi:hypothetical protein
MLDGAMAEPVLDQPYVVALVRERVAAGVPEHVGVNFEQEARALADALDQPIDGIGRCLILPLAIRRKIEPT